MIKSLMLTVRVTFEDVSKLQSKADSRQCSISSLIRRGIKLVLEESEGEYLPGFEDDQED